MVPLPALDSLSPIGVRTGGHSNQPPQSGDEDAEIGLGSAAEGTPTCAEQRAYLPAGSHQSSEFLYILYAPFMQIWKCKFGDSEQNIMLGIKLKNPLRLPK